MTGYVRKDTTNNIADGNVINAADLDSEFDGVQAAFNASTGHKHDGTASEGATINSLGPTQDVTISASLVAPKTTNFVDIGSSGLKFKDMFLAGNGSIGGTLAVTGVATFTAQPILSSLTASRAVFSDGSKGLVSNAITGTGNVVMSASPTLTGTVGGASLTLSSLTSGRVTYAGASGLLQDSANLLFNGTTLTANTLNLTNALGTTYGGTGLTSFTSGGVVYASSTSALATGSVLTFDGTNFATSNSMRVTGSTASYASGAGTEITYISGSTKGGIQVYDRTASAYRDVFLDGANALFQISGSEQMRLTSTGLGIGTSSPAAPLTIQKASSFVQVNSTGTGATYARFNNSGGPFIYAGVESSAGASVVPGTSAYSAIFGTDGAYSVQFFTNNSVRATLDSSGNLGLGVTPSAWNSNIRVINFGNTSRIGAIYQDFGYYGEIGLATEAYIAAGSYTWNYATSNPAVRYAQNGPAGAGTHAWYTAPSGTAGNAITFTQAMTLDDSGNLLVGVTSGTRNWISKNNAGGYALTINNSNANPLGTQIYHNTDTNGAGNQFLDCQGAAQVRAQIRSNGGIANYQANDVNLSDRREKTNFAPSKSYLDIICAIPVQTFNYIDQSEDDPGLTLGVVAQDVQAVAPELVMESNWGTKEEPKQRLSIYQTDLQYALMKCIQEQQATIQSLTDRIAQLEAK